MACSLPASSHRLCLYCKLIEHVEFKDAFVTLHQLLE